MTGLIGLLRGLAVPFKWWVTVAPWEQGLRVRVGKTAKLLLPGLHFVIPFFDRCYVASVRLRMLTDVRQTVSTADGHPVTLSVAVQFRIDDLRALFLKCANPETTILARVASVCASTVSAATRDSLSPRAIEDAAGLSVPADWGVAELSVRVVDFVQVRTLRLLSNDYRQTSELDQLLAQEDRRRVNP